MSSEVMPHQKRDRWSGVVLALLLLAAFGLVARRIVFIATGPVPPGVGIVAPAFVAPTLTAGSDSLEKYKGKVVLIDFWATWCPPCVATMPALDRLHEKYGPAGFSVIGVNIEPGEEAAVRAFLEERQIGFPIVVDAGELQKKYGVYSYPTSFLVDREGVIRSVFRGPADEKVLRDLIEELLKKENAS